MKKSTILGVLTAAALITTSAATYAAWDQTTTTFESNKFTLRQNVTLTSSPASFAGGDTLSTGEDGIAYTGEVTFTATAIELVDTLTLTPTVTKTEDSTTIDPSLYSIKIEQEGASLTPNGTSFVDKSIDTTNTYKVTLNVKDNSLAGKEVKVSIDGALTKSTPVE